mmetsp:Transcript_65116/g.209907  ORF Transcript_65116/g.209907 Transcript_65116/m.209907 type:complete len:236 (+) Transcript_65116:426-1133(+)
MLLVQRPTLFSSDQACIAVVGLDIVRRWAPPAEAVAAPDLLGLRPHFPPIVIVGLAVERDRLGSGHHLRGHRTGGLTAVAAPPQLPAEEQGQQQQQQATGQCDTEPQVRPIVSGHLHNLELACTGADVLVRHLLPVAPPPIADVGGQLCRLVLAADPRAAVCAARAPYSGLPPGVEEATCGLCERSAEGRRRSGGHDWILRGQRLPPRAVGARPGGHHGRPPWAVGARLGRQHWL